MSQILEPLAREQAPEGTHATFDHLRDQLGRVPNLYAAIAHSAPALNGSLTFAATLSQGALTGREIETVLLAVAQANECEYGVAVHTRVGQLQKLTAHEAQALRTAHSADPSLNILAALTLAIVNSRGWPAPYLVDQFFVAGYTQAALVELLGFAALGTFNTYV